jgi:hypothetical protein
MPSGRIRGRNLSPIEATQVTPFLALVLACTPKDTGETVELPPDTDTYPADTDPVEFPEDTSLDSDLNVSPTHTLTMHQWGTWDVSEDDAMTGRLRFQEWVDDAAPDNDTAETDTTPDTDLPLECDLEIALSGAPAAAPPCSGCDAPWEITFTVVSGTPAKCHDPELPADGTTRVMAWHPSGHEVEMDFGNIGLWLPWYTATKTADTVTFDWTATVGVSIPDMDR